jgi:TonB family protein
VRKLFYSTCLLLLAIIPSYAQQLQDKLVGKWAFVNKKFVGEASEDLITWKSQLTAPYSVYEFSSGGTVKHYQSPTYSTTSTFSIQDSLMLVINNESSSQKYKIEKLTSDTLQIRLFNLYLSKGDSLQGNIIQSRLTYKRLPGDSLVNSPDDTARPLGRGDSIVVEDMPRFPGGQAGLMDFLSKKAKYPKAALRAGVSGTAWVFFIVSPTGEVVDGEVIRSPRLDFAMEAVRVFKQMPRWTPGKQNGKPVPVRYILPLRFKT